MNCSPQGPLAVKVMSLIVCETPIDPCPMPTSDFAYSNAQGVGRSPNKHLLKMKGHLSGGALTSDHPTPRELLCINHQHNFLFHFSSDTLVSWPIRH
jgi:hypothetical protein